MGTRNGLTLGARALNMTSSDFALFQVRPLVGRYLNLSQDCQVFTLRFGNGKAAIATFGYNEDGSIGRMVQVSRLRSI